MTALFSGESLSVQTIVGLLSPTLGSEKSADVVLAAVRRLGLPEGGINAAQAAAILDDLARATGIVGVTARFAKQRTDFSRFADAAPVRRTTRPPPAAGTTPLPAVAAAKPAAIRLSASDLAGLLAHTIGEEKSEEAITAAAERLGLTAGSLARAEAIAVFEELARQPGLIGITARFTKSRIAARFGG